MVQWWTPEQSSTILAYAGSAVGLCWALVGVTGVLAAKGRARRAVSVITIAMSVLGIAAVCAGVVAIVLGQPWHVVQPPVLGGGLVALLGAVIHVSSRRAFALDEQRRIAAAAIRQG